ncbi:MAG: RNB domain-containing ribonuclease, partial [Acetobacteraceae bacterium]|nr:RNB domain-containing ribonuclease [Acetobacteraceae bacterium]
MVPLLGDRCSGLRQAQAFGPADLGAARARRPAPGVPSRRARDRYLRDHAPAVMHRQTKKRSGRTRPDRPGRARLGEVAVVVVTGIDPDGDALARPFAWDEEGAPPLILMAPEPRGHAALAPGQRVLARLRPAGPGRYEGRTIRRLTESPGRILGVFQPGPAGARIEPTDRRAKSSWTVAADDAGGAEAGEIVLAEPLPRHHRTFGPGPARVVERLGRMGDARAISMISIATHAIPHVFPDAALRAAARARGAALAGREDLRAIPLVTIDGEDARDFDDAVFAEPDGEGWRLIVAIADVAHYVRPGTALDQAARERGNSTYFPDRVVPMLPEALSNGWCSLRPDENRGCLFAELRVDAAG